MAKSKKLDDTKLPEVLTPKEEFDLAVSHFDNGDVDAARRLILANLRFVYFIAKGYKGYGLPQQDLIQEGTMGLMKAVQRFDPYKGVKLISFAVHYIRSEIHEFIIANWGIVKAATTKAQRKLFFNLRKNKKSFDWLTNSEVNELAEELDVTPEDIRKMEIHLLKPHMSYDNSSEDDELGFNPANHISDENSNFSEQLEDSEFSSLTIKYLQEAIVGLDERSRDIIEQRWLSDKKTNLQELSEKYNVSAERIRQIETAAFKKIKEKILNNKKMTAFLPIE